MPVRVIPGSSGGRRRLAVLLGVAALTAVTYVGLLLFVPDFALDSRAAWMAIRTGEGSLETHRGRLRRRLWTDDGRTWLWGGHEADQHFDVSTCRVDPATFNYGLGREYFPALVEPAFMTAIEADRALQENARVLVVKIDDEVRIYPLTTVRRHEVVNDVVGGVPIFAAFCVLADLGAVYDRRLAGHTFTFAVSGYSHAEEGIWDGHNAFVLWDRDTESLWWPPIGRAVSGPMVDAPLRMLDQDLWSQTTWGEVRSVHPNALVLKGGQTMDTVPRVTRYEPGSRPVTATPTTSPDHAIAPRWGDNAVLAK